MITDGLRNQEANDFIAGFIHRRIAETVTDPDTARKLMPTDHPVGTRRPCLDTDYYATYNRENVELADIRADPIVRITQGGIQTRDRHYPLDMIVFALGFDAFTGPVANVDLRNAKGENLSDVWRDGPRTYLGMTTAGFPNLFIVTGPLSPSVLANMVLAVEHDIEWIGRAIADLDRRGLRSIEATTAAQEAWVAHVAELRQRDPLSQGQQLVSGRQHAGQGPRLPALCRRLQHLYGQMPERR